MSLYLADLTNLILWPSALHPTRLSELSTEKIIEMFVQANPRKSKLERVSEYVDGVNSIYVCIYLCDIDLVSCDGVK